MVQDVAWYYSTGGQDRVGPVSWADIEAAHAGGILGPSSLLWASHLPGWVPAATLLGAPEPVQVPAPAPPQAPPQAVPAPGARAAFHCGLWGLVSMFLCFPVALVLGVVAIVQNRKADRMARENPGTYLPPGNGGLVMGIIALAAIPVLAIIGIVSAIAIPALLSQRARARDKACVVNLRQHMDDLVSQYDRLKERNAPPQQIREALEEHLRQGTAAQRNPWNVQAPAFSYTIAVVERTDTDTFDEAARAGAGELGQCSYLIQFPAPDQPGLLGGAVRTKNPVGGTTCVVKITTLD